MTLLFLTAFMLGIMGGFHCIGMCGPLALSLPYKNNTIVDKVVGATLYNSGRVVSYALLGVVFGVIGQSASLFGFQQLLSVILGVSIILFIIFSKAANRSFLSTMGNTVFSNIRKGIGMLFKQRTNRSLVSIGLLNGLLPCGLVYLAIAGAVSTGSIIKSSLFMASFGLGTFLLCG